MAHGEVVHCRVVLLLADDFPLSIAERGEELALHALVDRDLSQAITKLGLIRDG